MQMLITGYSHAKHEMKLGDVMHGNMHLLPPHLRGDFVLAYRSTAKLSSQFVTYRFPRKERSRNTEVSCGQEVQNTALAGVERRESWREQRNRSTKLCKLLLYGCLGE